MEEVTGSNPVFRTVPGLRAKLFTSCERHPVRPRMRNNPRREFWFFSLSLIALRLADVGITYVVTPDLRWEINPLVSLAGLGWLALIVANVVGVAVVVLLLYFSQLQVPAWQVPEPGYSQKEFVSHLFVIHGPIQQRMYESLSSKNGGF